MLAILLISISLGWHQYQVTRPFSGVPTVFLHGYNGTANSTNQMIASLDRAGVAKRTMRVTVAPDGKLKVHGRLYGKNPIVQVVYQDNHNGKQFTNWLLKVYAMLHSRYQVQRVNAVGHSAGAIAVVEAAMKHPAVKLNKLVSIAGPFNGVFGKGAKPNRFGLDKNGKPTTESPKYQQMLAEANDFQANKVLNMYGNLEDGSRSDGVVTINDARSLKYLLHNWHGAYQEREVRGKHAQHSKLHQRNWTVDMELRKFLFPRQ